MHQPVETAPPADAASSGTAASADAAPSTESRAEPKTAFGALEERLLEAPVHLRFEVSAEGAIEVSLRGELHIGPTVDLRARGRFAGEDHDLHLWTEGDRLRLGPEDAPTVDVPRPPALTPALVVGLTRMGVLHNIAMLVGGAMPDHADGGVETWVEAVELHRPSPAPSSGDALAFEIVVAGQPSGRATLWLDEHGMPQRREQVVDFPDGQMRVTERYEVVESPSPSSTRG